MLDGISAFSTHLLSATDEGYVTPSEATGPQYEQDEADEQTPDSLLASLEGT